MYEMNFNIPKSSEESRAEGIKQDERLTKEEALLYQDYATKKEGIEFSQQADEQSYAEAESLINEIREKGIELEGADLDSVDLRDIAQQDLLGERLEQRVAHLAVKNEDEGIMQKIGEVIGAKGIKKIVMLLSLFSILSAGTAEAKGSVNSVKQNHKEEIKKHETIRFHGVDASFEYDNAGAPIGCSIKMKRTIGGEEALRMEMASRKMLVDNYMEILMKAGGNRSLYGIEMNLKSERRNFLLRADLYHKLQQNNMMTEAKFVKQMMLKSIVRTEAMVGVEIFDRKALGEILNTEK